MISKRFLLLILFLAIFIYSGLVFSPLKADVEPIDGTDVVFEKIKDLQKDEQKNQKRVFIVTVTGYSSSYDETDDDPYITASGDWVHMGTAATNFLPIGTKIKIPSLFGNQIFIVKDRMNKRYYYRIDIWFPSKEDAVNFGIHYNVPVEIVD